MKRAFIASTAVALVAGAVYYNMAGDNADSQTPPPSNYNDLSAIVVTPAPPRAKTPEIPTPIPHTTPVTAPDLKKNPVVQPETKQVTPQPEAAQPETAQPEAAQPKVNTPALTQPETVVVQPPPLELPPNQALYPTPKALPQPPEAFPETSPFLPNIYSGLCITDKFAQGVSFEVLHTKDAQGRDQSQLWFGQRGWLQMFYPQVPPGVQPDKDNIYRVPLHSEGLTIAYDLGKQIGRATMTPETFDKYFNNLSKGTLYQNQWSCSISPARSSRLIPKSLIK